MARHFTMSKYTSKEDLYKDMANYYKNMADRFFKAGEALAKNQQVNGVITTVPTETMTELVSVMDDFKN